uniref:FIIND domain-containing protein n=1 Tax=Lates calcarifer TaxID=8187 RepID=A0A4W6FZK8_LATCA
LQILSAVFWSSTVLCLQTAHRSLHRHRNSTVCVVFLQFEVWSGISTVSSQGPSVSCRFRCPGPGGFQCSSTGLVFVVDQEAELLYRTVQWDESLLQSAGKKAAGPLFSIQCPEAAVCELHLPHCETKQGLLSVVHISDDGLSILEPLEITGTHVVVKVPHLSVFGLVWDFIKRFVNITLPVEGQVLLFLRPDEGPRILDVFLLQGNIPLSEVKSAQQRGAKYIKTSSDSNCKLYIGQSYSVHCEPNDLIQPERINFRSKYGPNYFPTFEVFLTLNPERATVMIQDQERTEVWRRNVPLTGEDFISSISYHPSVRLHVSAAVVSPHSLNKNHTWILKSELDNAERRITVDLMVQKYGGGAVQVMRRVLTDISRNDLVKQLPAVGSGAEGQSHQITEY